MKFVLAISLVVIAFAAYKSGASPLVRLPQLPIASTSYSESFQLQGFRILRRKDISACLIIPDVPQVNKRAVDDAEFEYEPEEKDLSEVVNAAQKIKDICGSFKTVFLLNQNGAGASSSASVGVERSFTGGNTTDIIGSIAQISQSLFGVWAFPGIG